MSNEIDLDNCSREPIHIPGAIQPHGYLLALHRDTLKIQHVSENLMILMDCQLEGLIGKGIDRLISEGSHKRLREALETDDLRQVNPLPFDVVRSENDTVSFDGIVHRSGPFVILEWEPAHRNGELLEGKEGDKSRANPMSFFSFFHSVRQGTLALQAMHSYADLFRIASEQVKRITGFDRVLVYQFEADWTGVTVAEVRESHMDSYLGLRFPASDIPEQARRLYEKNWLRLIADVEYTPAQIVPLSPAPIDLSQSTLRSVSPVHLEYMRNMKTNASMSVSIIKDGKLWGLISCHHASARYVDYQTRIACEFVGQILSQQIGAIEAKENQALRQKLKKEGEDLFQGISLHGLTKAFENTKPRLAELADADGAAVVTPEGVLRFGHAPSENEIKALVNGLKGKDLTRYYATDELGREFPGLKLDATHSPGLLAVPVSSNHDTFLLWFRRELTKNVSWAGQPMKIHEKAVGLESPHSRLHPRTSFDSWQETKRGTAERWRAAEIEAALELRNNILSEELGRANAELALSNDELDAFASIAAHDLKEPIRGIKNYASFIYEDDQASLAKKSIERLDTILKLCDRTDSLLTSLYQYSRVGRVKLSMLPTDMNHVLSEVLVRLKPALDENHAEILVPKPLPRLVCDSIRSGEVFYNLIVNAMKYNREDKKIIEIGCEKRNGDDLFYVKDNGIGIPEEQLDSVFRMFKRLHADGMYGGGTGSGLAIVKKIIERHSGQIWAESKGKGSTFYFNFGPVASR